MMLLLLPFNYFLSDFALLPVYRPNHAAPAPTTIDTKPDCSIVGPSNSIYHITTLYNRKMYVDMNTLGNILQLSTALAKCISLAYGFTPKSLIEVSTSKSTLIFCFGSATFICSSLIPVFASLLLFCFLLLYGQLTTVYKSPFPKVSSFLILL